MEIKSLEPITEIKMLEPKLDIKPVEPIAETKPVELITETKPVEPITEIKVPIDEVSFCAKHVNYYLHIYGIYQDKVYEYKILNSKGGQTHVINEIINSKKQYYYVSDLNFYGDFCFKRVYEQTTYVLSNTKPLDQILLDINKLDNELIRIELNTLKTTTQLYYRICDGFFEVDFYSPSTETTLYRFQTRESRILEAFSQGNYDITCICGTQLTLWFFKYYYLRSYFFSPVKEDLNKKTLLVEYKSPMQQQIEELVKQNADLVKRIEQLEQSKCV